MAAWALLLWSHLGISVRGTECLSGDAKVSLLQVGVSLSGEACPEVNYLSPPWVTGLDTPNPYENVMCTDESLARIQVFSQNNPFLIISGQGGSDTRAAQEVVQKACTHGFGSVDTDTHDAWACRFAAADSPAPHPLGDYTDPFVYALLEQAATINYTLESIHPELRQSERELACRTLIILEKMGGGHPMAMKEPWLRVSLPFYTSMANVKFVHVTRDVRNIHYSHGEETFGNLVVQNMQDILEDVAEIALRATPTPGTMTWGERSKWPKIVQESETGELQQLAIFANVWASMELTLHQQWMNAWPDKYYHVSELRMVNDGKAEAKRLAQFLGNFHPSESILTKMMATYQPEHVSKASKDHWNIMQEIVNAPSSGHVLCEALTSFGYEL